MAFGRLERTPGVQPMSDINMTPLIDVMLVLLVIFMITAPLMTSSLKLDLPKSDAAQASETPQFVAVALDKDGRLFFGDEAVDGATFAARIADAAKRNPQTEVQLRADRSVPYGRVRRADRHGAKGGTQQDRLRRRSGAGGQRFVSPPRKRR